MSGPASAPAELEPAQVLARLTTTRLGRSLRILSVSDSTNDDARRDALGGAPDGHVVVADAQRKGRGSHGRDWASPPADDLYLSIVARPPLALPQLPPLTLAVGLGVAGAVESLIGRPGPAVEVKWPNDVRVGGRKCAGILIEASSLGSELGPLVIGIGLNVNRLEWPQELQATATSLRAATGRGERFDRTQVLAQLLADVESWIDRFVMEGGAAVAAALDAKLAMRGQWVRCGGVEGRLAGVAPSGAVRIETERGVRELVGGRLE